MATKMIPETQPTTSPPPWKVGELASRTGMSVRALHHYDEIGLLTPSLRTPSGHRLYQQADIERLQQIQSLRMMGIQLEEVKRLLDGAEMTPRKVIDMHLARLQQEIASQNRLAERMKALVSQLKSLETASVDDLCRIIQAMTTMEKYFTPEQLETLRKKRSSVSPEYMESVRAAWGEILPQVRKAMEENVDPTSPEILAIAKRWKSLADEFTGGDPEMEQAVRTMYQHERPMILQNHGDVPTPDMFEYMGKAFAVLPR